MTKIKEIFRKNTEEDVKMNVKWSLKKKLLVAGGLVGSVVLGIFAYGKTNGEEPENEESFEDEEDYDYSTDETEDLDDTNVSEESVEAQ